MKRVYSELLTSFSEGEREGIVTREVKRGAGRLSILRREGQGSLAYDIFLKESLFLNSSMKDLVCRAVSDVLHNLLKAEGYTLGKRVLVVGLGNEGMIADALGTKILSHLAITGHLASEDRHGSGVLYALKSSVSGVTGLQSFDVVKGLCDRIKPDIVIAADTLACSSPSRLGKVIQLSNAGIAPGSGVGNTKRRLDKKSLGCPVIALGVPLVIYLKNILKTLLSAEPSVHINVEQYAEIAEMVVTLKEIDVLVEDFAEVIGNGINRAIHVLRWV